MSGVLTLEALIKAKEMLDSREIPSVFLCSQKHFDTFLEAGLIQEMDGRFFMFDSWKVREVFITKERL